MTGAQFEISIDSIPRTYRDRKDFALQSAQFLKSRNPNSVVKLKDLKSGEEIVVAFQIEKTWPSRAMPVMVSDQNHRSRCAGPPRVS